jgi:hypothetical protein
MQISLLAIDVCLLFTFLFVWLYTFHVVDVLYLSADLRKICVFCVGLYCKRS